MYLSGRLEMGHVHTRSAFPRFFTHFFLLHATHTHACTGTAATYLSHFMWENIEFKTETFTQRRTNYGRDTVCPRCLFHGLLPWMKEQMTVKLASFWNCWSLKTKQETSSCRIFCFCLLAPPCARIPWSYRHIHFVIHILIENETIWTTGTNW